MASGPCSVLEVGKIDDVLELSRNTPKFIPERFVKDINERVQEGETFSESSEIPVIDFHKLTNGNQMELNSELNVLAKACEEWGFFQVTNHGIRLSLVDEMEDLCREFFMLPLEEKKRYPMKPGTVQGYGQAFVFSEEQKLDWCNMYALGVNPSAIRMPDLWPIKPTSFSSTIDEYSVEVRKLCSHLVGFIAMTLGLKQERLSEMFGTCVQAVRMNHYPACSRPDLVMGLSAHSDGSAISVLQEAKGCPLGLQIMKNGKWVWVKPLPNTFVVNIGDSMEVLTNGKYKSVEHRAVTNLEGERISIVTFYAPSYEVEIGPMEEMIDESNPRRYRTYNHGEYSKHYVTHKLEGKKSLDFAKL